MIDIIFVLVKVLFVVVVVVVVIIIVIIVDGIVLDVIVMDNIVIDVTIIVVGGGGCNLSGGEDDRGSLSYCYPDNVPCHRLLFSTIDVFQTQWLKIKQEPIQATRRYL